MRTSTTPNSSDPNVHDVSYQLPIGEQTIDMNALIGRRLSVSFSGKINCVHCHRETKKSFNQGYCFPCVRALAQCDTCIIKPEQCHYHEGTCREPKWGEENCFQDHFVYLANTGALKVGITRHVTEGVSSRWVDQGATQAMAILRVPDRRISGLVETAFKGHVGDKTNWRTMLKGEADSLDLTSEKQRLLNAVDESLNQLANDHSLTAFSAIELQSHTIKYPVKEYPVKIKSINLDKTPTFSGTLNGIKGQYWLLDEDRVINIRKYAGYELSIAVES
jgi:hypothetical protein